MAMLTDMEIADIFTERIKASTLMSSVNGVLRKNGKRSANSRKEDIIIHVVANVNGEIQRAQVQVDIYTQDITRDGELVPNDSRIRTLSAAARDLLQHGKKGLNMWDITETDTTDTGSGEHIIQNIIKFQHYNY